MPRTDVFFYKEGQEDVPVLDWLKELRRSHQRAYESCVAAIGRLADLGHELRRPLADILTEGIYELRIRKGRVNFRMLYFFHGRNVAVLSHALTKEDKVPRADIERAIRRKKAFEADPTAHSHFEELEEEDER
jgi:phage-related protein